MVLEVKPFDADAAVAQGLGQRVGQAGRGPAHHPEAHLVVVGVSGGDARRQQGCQQLALLGIEFVGDELPELAQQPLGRGFHTSPDAATPHRLRQFLSERHAMIWTGVPNGRMAASAVMPAFDIRMQPWLTSLPRPAGSLVPWMPITPSPPAKLCNTSENPDSP